MMEKSTVVTIMELTLAVEKCKMETKTALELIFSNLNHGQTNKLLKKSRDSGTRRQI